MNKVILAGRLVRDPKLRYTQTGKTIPIIVWDKLAEVCSKHLFKGSQVLIEGRMQVRNYEAQDGSKRYVTEVIAQELEFMGTKPIAVTTENKPLSTQAQSFGSEVPEDEEIPF